MTVASFLNFDPGSFLNFGITGLFGLIIWLFWRIFDREQKRPGTPRKSILWFAGIFIGLAVFLASAGVTLELAKIKNARDQQRQWEQLSGELANAKAEISGLRARVDGGKDLITQLEGFIQFLQGAIKELPDTKEITAATPGLSPFNKAIAPSNFSAHVELPENSALKSKAKAPRNLMQNVEEYLKSENH